MNPPTDLPFDTGHPPTNNHPRESVILPLTLLSISLLFPGCAGVTTKYSVSSSTSSADGQISDSGGRNQYTEAVWRAQIKKVHLGMQQYEVVRILPQRSEGNQDFARDGASYTVTYALDENWSVATGYDRSGYHEENNPYSVMGFPNDRVIVLPRLLKQRNRLDEIGFPPQTPLYRAKGPAISQPGATLVPRFAPATA